MKPALLLFRGRGLLSALIRWQTRGKYSHAAIQMRDGRIVESWPGVGVRAKTITDWEGIDRFDIPTMDDTQWDHAIAFMLSRVGKKYDMWAIIRFISRKNMPKNNRWFCSEIVFSALQSAGVELLQRIESWAVSPWMLGISPLITPDGRQK